MACKSCQVAKPPAKLNGRARNPQALFPGPLAQAGFYGPNMGRGFPRNLGPGYRRRPGPGFAPAWPSLNWWGPGVGYSYAQPYAYQRPVLAARVAAPVALQVGMPGWARRNRVRAYY